MSLEAIPSAQFCDFLADAPDYADMAEFPTPLYSRKQVVKAGKALCEPMPWSEDRAEEYRQVFKVAYDWRASHAYPMRKLRQDLRNTIRDQKAKGLTAARLKRMRSIRKKLERLRVTQIEAAAPEFGALLRGAYEQVRSTGTALLVQGRVDHESQDSLFRYHETAFLPLGISDAVVDHLLIVGVQVPTPFWELPEEKLQRLTKQFVASTAPA